MHELTLELLRCVRCGSRLAIDVLKTDKEIEEGILECKKCKLCFPIIEKIPIMWDDFSKYLSSHKVLSGKLYRIVKTDKMKNFLKITLSKATFSDDDNTALEERWSNIYQNSKNSKFYSLIKHNLDSIPKSKLILEHGCSVGTVTSYLADSHKMVFGLDKSFNALNHAKKSFRENLDYIVADSLSPVFGKLQFDLLLALNILELIEPNELLKIVSKQTSGYCVISDPYDFDRGRNSVRKTLDESILRTKMKQLGFKITANTKNPSYLPWNLKLNPRATLNYKVDLVIGKK